MDINTRYEIMALIEKLTDNASPTFNAADARRLIALVPEDKSLFGNSSISYTRSTHTSTFKGYAAGFGNAEIPNHPKGTTTSEWKTGEKHLIGGFTIVHWRGALDIQHMWANTHEDQTEQRVQLRYNRRTGEPKDLRLWARYAFLSGNPGIRLFQLNFHLYHWTPWKLPAT